MVLFAGPGDSAESVPIIGNSLSLTELWFVIEMEQSWALLEFAILLL